MLYSEGMSVTRIIDTSMRVTDLFVKDGQPFDVVICTLDGMHGTFVNHISDKYYYVIEGSADMRVGANYYKINTGDFVHIPKETPHYVCGNIKFMVISSPKYDYRTEDTISDGAI